MSPFVQKPVLIQAQVAYAVRPSVALAAGAETFLISSNDEKLERAKALGAHHVLNYRATPQWGAAIVEQSGGRGMDLVVDVVGAGTLEQSVIALSNGGHISQVGVLGGFAAAVSLYPLMTKEGHVDGIMSGSRECAELMMRAIAHHRLRPVVQERHGLANLPKVASPGGSTTSADFAIGHERRARHVGGAAFDADSVSFFHRPRIRARWTTRLRVPASSLANRFSCAT
jgi:hypothetical protein